MCSPTWLDQIVAIETFILLTQPIFSEKLGQRLHFTLDSLYILLIFVFFFFICKWDIVC